MRGRILGTCVRSGFVWKVISTECGYAGVTRVMMKSLKNKSGGLEVTLKTITEPHFERFLQVVERRAEELAEYEPIRRELCGLPEEGDH